MPTNRLATKISNDGNYLKEMPVRAIVLPTQVGERQRGVCFNFQPPVIPLPGREDKDSIEEHVFY